MSDQSAGQAIFHPVALDDADNDGVSPKLIVAVYDGALPRERDHIAIPDSADDIATLGPEHVRVRFNGESTLMQTHFIALPSGDGYIQCDVTLYGGMNGVAADRERRRRWMQQLCEGIQPR